MNELKEYLNNELKNFENLICKSYNEEIRAFWTSKFSVILNVMQKINEIELNSEHKKQIVRPDQTEKYISGDNTLTIKNQDIDTFHFMGNTGKEILSISKDGIKFNRDYFDDFTPDDFALCFIDCLERSFKIKIDKTEN